MMKEWKKVFFAILSVLGCLLGAGFISGAEINTFFVRFGWWGILGIAISCVLLVSLIYFQ